MEEYLQRTINYEKDLVASLEDGWMRPNGYDGDVGVSNEVGVRIGLCIDLMIS